MKSLIPLFAVFFFNSSLQAQTTWIVDQAGGGNFTDIDSAINASVNGDTVIVRDGVYPEVVDFYGKSILLQSENGPPTTMISGDQVNPFNVFFQRGEGASSRLDGFTVTGGSALYCSGSSSPTIVNCVFDANNNSGVYCRDYSSPALINCLFTNNNSYMKAGGLQCFDYSFPVLTNCTFSDNSGGDGGAIYCDDNSHPTLDSCTFLENEASTGGAIYAEGTSYLVLTNCDFLYNTIVGSNWPYGGALYIRSDIQLTGCTFKGNGSNLSYRNGGAIFASGDVSLNNCAFSENMAGGDGGAIYYEGGSLSINSCTFSENVAGIFSDGGAIYCDWSRTPDITNSIIWGNRPNNVFGASQSSIFTYSCIEAGAGQTWFGNGCIDANPLFVDQTNGNLHLQPASPCIDAGDPNSSLDPDGTSADMGAFHFDQSGGAPTLSVSNLVAGQQVLIEVNDATPNNYSHFTWSINGGGPTPTPWGDAMVTHPFGLKLLPTDSTGYTSYTANIPLHLSGVTVWCHGTDVGNQSMLNALMLVIQ